MIVFHNINNAKSDVLSKISDIFNNNYIYYSNYSLIGLLNTNESLIDRDLYYNNLFSTSIFYKVENLKFSNIVKIMNQKNKLIPYSLLKYFKNDQNENMFTLNDISKYKELKEKSEIDDIFLEEIIFKNKKLTHNKQLKYKNNNINELSLELEENSFKYDNSTNKMTMLLNNKEMENFIDRFNTLSYEQKKCFMFLDLLMESKKPCIIQGPTGVGKSHLIKFFSELLGKKLHVFEFNEDNNISLLQKRFFFKDYSPEEKRKILKKSKKPKLIENQKDKLEDKVELEYNLIKNRFKI